MKIKSILFLIILGLALSFWACEKDKFDGKPPVILLNGELKLADTLKYSTVPNFTFDFSVVDDRDWRQLSIINVQNGLVFYENRIVNDQPINLPAITSGQLRYQALGPGSEFFTIEVSDASGLRSSADIELVILDNLPPVAILSLTQTNEISPYQVSMDGSKSFDADNRWGGEIQNFEYRLNGFYTTQLEEDIIQYIYPEPGVYQVGLRVQDNDGLWSEWDTKSVEVK